MNTTTRAALVAAGFKDYVAQRKLLLSPPGPLGGGDYLLAKPWGQGQWLVAISTTDGKYHGGPNETFALGFLSNPSDARYLQLVGRAANGQRANGATANDQSTALAPAARATVAVPYKAPVAILQRFRR